MRDQEAAAFSVFKVPPRFHRMPLMEGGQCYANAANTALDHPELRYAEGYAESENGLGLWVHHAWNVDADGAVIDRTWLTPGLTYVGCVVDVSKVYAAALVRGKYHGPFFPELPDSREMSGDEWAENGDYLVTGDELRELAADATPAEWMHRSAGR